VLAGDVIERLARYVKRGGRLALLRRSGRFALEEGQPNFPLLKRLKCPNQDSQDIETWPFGKGCVMRVGRETNWKSAPGTETLLRLMDWLQVERPITATPDIHAALSRGVGGDLFATLYWPNAEPGNGSMAVQKRLLGSQGQYGVTNLFDREEKVDSVDVPTLERGMAVSFAPYELKVLRLTPE
jgi:hypothetical protein